MAEPIDFTIWNVATGEVFATGSRVDPSAPEGHAMWLGEKIDADTHVFGDDGLPVPRLGLRPLEPEMFAILVNRERQRRIEDGKVIGGVRVTGRDEDARNLTNLAVASQMRLATGDTTTLTVFRDGDNVDHELTPLDLLGLWQTSVAYVSALYQASWDLKAMSPRPDNVTDPAFWPVP